MTICVIDADGHWRNALIRALRVNWPGVKIYESGSGLEGVCMARHLSPDAVLSGLALADVDGLALVGAVRRQSRRTRILVTSQVSEEWLISHALALGADYYMLRPVEPGLVCRRVGALLKPAGEREPEKPGHGAAQVLRSLELPEHSAAFAYLTEAARLIRADGRALSALSERVYAPIARRAGRSPQTVERAVRGALARLLRLHGEEGLCRRLGEAMEASSPALDVRRFLVLLSAAGDEKMYTGALAQTGRSEV